MWCLPGTLLTSGLQTFTVQLKEATTVSSEPGVRNKSWACGSSVRCNKRSSRIGGLIAWWSFQTCLVTGL